MICNKLTWFRGETTLEASFQRKLLNGRRTVEKAGPRGTLVDFKINGPFRHEYFVNESAPHVTHEDHDPEYQHYKKKLARHMNDMMWRLESETHMKNIQLLGSLTTGLRWSVYGMTHQGYMSFFDRLESVAIPSARRGMRSLINAMKLVMRVYNHLEKQCDEALEAGERTQPEEPTF